jgi:osmotically inducible protein OsmC
VTSQSVAEAIRPNAIRKVIEMSATQERSETSALLEGGAVTVWNGDLRNGMGSLRFELGAGGELPLSWPGGSAYGPGATSPEELAAAAHAACLTMTLAHTLAREQHTPRKIATEAKVSFGVAAHSRVILRSRLEITVDADGLSEAELNRAAELAGRYCPVSNTFRAAGVALEVRARIARE